MTDIAAQLDSGSSLTGDLGDAAGTAYLGATLDSTSFIQADLTLPGQPLAATLDSTSSITADLSEGFTLSARLESNSQLVADLTADQLPTFAPVTEIDFSELNIDLPTRSLTRLLDQFDNSCVLQGIVKALAGELQELYDAIVEMMRLRTLYSATGVNLDVLGRIVGQRRILLNAANLEWFGYDGIDSRIGPYDSAPYFSENAPLFGDLPANDRQYRALIQSKIFKNHIKATSVPELLTFVKQVTGHDISIISDGPMDIILVVPAEMSLNDLTTITTVYDDETADRKYILPVSATVRITGVQRVTGRPFTYDTVSLGYDSGSFTVTIDLSQGGLI